MRIGSLASDEATTQGALTPQEEVQLQKDIGTIEFEDDKATSFEDTLDKVEHTIATAEAMIQVDEALLDGSVTTAQAQAIVLATTKQMQVAKSIMEPSVTFEDATTDPAMAVQAAKDDKRTMVRKLIDVAKKAVTKLVETYNKNLAKVIGVFGRLNKKTDGIVKAIDEQETYNESAKLDKEQTLEFRSRFEALGWLMTNDENAAFEFGGLLAGDKLEDIKIPSNLDKVSELPDFLTDAEFAKADKTVVGLRGNKLYIKYTWDDDGEKKIRVAKHEIDLSLKEDEELQISPKDKLSVTASQVRTVGKNFSKTVEKAFRGVTEAEKNFDSVSKGLKDLESDANKKKYNEALALYKAAPRIAYRKSMTHYGAVVDILWIIELTLSVASEKPEEK